MEHTEEISGGDGSERLVCPSCRSSKRESHLCPDNWHGWDTRQTNCVQLGTPFKDKPLITEQVISKLKRLNAAYIAALNSDYCPEPEECDNFYDVYDLGITREEFKQALEENSGRRPDEIANEMTYVIIGL